MTNQSESFIHPVSERKDGIERFFKPAAPKPPKAVDTPTKRKVEEIEDVDEEIDEKGHEYVKGREEVEVHLEDEDDEVVFVGETKGKSPVSVVLLSASLSSVFLPSCS